MYYSILILTTNIFYPKSLSCFYHKRVLAVNLLFWQKDKVLQSVTRLIEVLPTAVSRFFMMAPQCSVNLSLQCLLSPNMPTYWGASLHLPALWLQVMEYTTLCTGRRWTPWSSRSLQNIDKKGCLLRVLQRREINHLLCAQPDVHTALLVWLYAKLTLTHLILCIPKQTQKVIYAFLISFSVVVRANMASQATFNWKGSQLFWKHT